MFRNYKIRVKLHEKNSNKILAQQKGKKKKMKYDELEVGKKILPEKGRSLAK